MYFARLAHAARRVNITAPFSRLNARHSTPAPNLYFHASADRWREISLSRGKCEKSRRQGGKMSGVPCTPTNQPDFPLVCTCQNLFREFTALGHARTCLTNSRTSRRHFVNAISILFLRSLMGSKSGGSYFIHYMAFDQAGF
jgi:hypothetical protein